MTLTDTSLFIDVLFNISHCLIESWDNQVVLGHPLYQGHSRRPSTCQDSRSGNRVRFEVVVGYASIIDIDQDATESYQY